MRYTLGHLLLCLLAIQYEASLGPHCRFDLLPAAWTSEIMDGPLSIPYWNFFANDLLFCYGNSWNRGQKRLTHMQDIISKFSFPNSGPNIFLLMCIFLPLNFLAATQDIAVDGWALTMLSR